jgi:hypothetical protein
MLNKVTVDSFAVDSIKCTTDTGEKEGIDDAREVWISSYAPFELWFDGLTMSGRKGMRGLDAGFGRYGNTHR